MNIKNFLFVESDTYWMQQLNTNNSNKDIKIQHVSSLIEAMQIISSGSNLYHGVVINCNCISQGSDISKLVENIKGQAPFIKIVFTLDSNNPHKIVEISNSDATGFLIKPYNMDSLLLEMNKTGNRIKHNFKKREENEIKVNGLSDLGIPNHDMGSDFNSEIGRNGVMNNFNGSNQTMNDFGGNPNMQGGIPNGFGGNPNMPNGLGGNPNMQGGIPNGMGGNPNMTNGFGGNQNMQGGRQGVVRIPKNTTIAVHCPKGGVGKSSISKELAVTYAMSQVNGERLKVCLVDMDIDYGDIAVMLEMKQSKSIADWARNIRQRMSQFGESEVHYSYEEADRFYLLTHKSGLKVLAAPTNHRDAAAINEEMVKTIINNLKTMFDVVIIDTGNNVKDFTVTSMELSDRILMVGNTDVSTINELLTLNKTLEQIQFPTNKIALLMNEVKKGEETQVQEIGTYLGLPIIGKLPKISAIEQANNNGDAISMNTQDNMFTVELKRVANSILPVVKRPNVQGGPKGNPKGGQKKGSFFGNLFKKK